MQNEQSSELLNKEKQKYSLLLNIRSTQPPGILTLKQLLAETQKDRPCGHPEHSDDFQSCRCVRWPNTSLGYILGGLILQMKQRTRTLWAVTTLTKDCIGLTKKFVRVFPLTSFRKSGTDLWANPLTIVICFRTEPTYSLVIQREY